MPAPSMLFHLRIRSGNTQFRVLRTRIKLIPKSGNTGMTGTLGVGYLHEHRQLLRVRQRRLQARNVTERPARPVAQTKTEEKMDVSIRAFLQQLHRCYLQRQPNVTLGRARSATKASSSCSSFASTTRMMPYTRTREEVVEVW